MKSIMNLILRPHFPSQLFVQLTIGNNPQQYVNQVPTMEAEERHVSARRTQFKDEILWDLATVITTKDNKNIIYFTGIKIMRQKMH